MGGERRELALSLVREEPARLTRSALVRRMGGRLQHNVATVAGAITAGDLHEVQAFITTANGRQLSIRVLVPGPGPESPPPPTAEEIVAFRGQWGWSRRKLAEQFNCSRSWINHLEQGRAKAPGWVRPRMEEIEQGPDLEVPDLDALMDEACASGADLARILGVSAVVVSEWRAGRKRIVGTQPAATREGLAALAEQRRQKVLAAIRKEPGITYERLTRGRLGRAGWVVRFVERMEAAREIHRSPTTYETASGVTKSAVGYFAGPPSPDAPRVRREDLGQLRRERGWSKAELGRRLGVTEELIVAWERGRQRLPEHRARQLWALFDANPAADDAARHDPIAATDAQLLGEVRAVLRKEPGLTGREIAGRMTGDVRRRWGTLSKAVQDGLAHRREETRPDASGRRYTRIVYYLGPDPGTSIVEARPAKLSDDELDARAIDVVRAHPGISTGAAARVLPGDTNRRHRSLRRIQESGAVEGRRELAPGPNGRRSWQVRLYPTAARPEDR